jgi:hypothetical protein
VVEARKEERHARGWQLQGFESESESCAFWQDMHAHATFLSWKIFAPGVEMCVGIWHSCYVGGTRLHVCIGVSYLYDIFLHDSSCVHVCIYTIHVHVYIHACIHTYICISLTYIYIYAYVCMCACICDVYVYTYMCVSVCVCVCVCVCVDAHTRVDRHKDSPIHSILTCMHVWHIYTGFCAQLLCVLSVFGMEIPTEMFGLQGLKLSLISHRASSDLDEDNLYATMAEYLIRGGSGRTQRVCAL